MKWHALQGVSIRLAVLPGWVLRLSHDGRHTLGVWTNGRAVFTVPAAQA